MGTFQPYTAWDGEMLQSCRCETPHNGQGAYGHDCQFFRCNSGDDPLTTGQRNEVQLIQCNAGTGSFGLRFPSGIKVTPQIPATADTAFIKKAIEGLGVREVKVAFTAGATQACHPIEAAQANPSGVVLMENVISVEFMQDFGRIEPLVADQEFIPTEDGMSEVKVATSGAPLGIQASVRGSKENKECSGRGLCDPLTGECLCYIIPMPGYRSSDGYGNPGNRGDCGAADDHKHLGNLNGGPTLCPGEIPCSSHGTCTGAPELRCRCADGWVSGDCSLRSCPKGWPWSPTDYFNVKTMLQLKKREKPEFKECSNMGTCDATKGECVCQPGFSGAACQIMEICPSLTAAACSGHGLCQSERQQFLDSGKKDADYTAIWDNSINHFSHHSWLRYRYGEYLHTCKCDGGYGGYDCSQILCPYGDDPDSPGLLEIQLLECHADAGTFSLQYGIEETAPIAASASAAQVKAALEALRAVSTVEVEYSATGAGACHTGANGTNVIRVTFHDYHYHYKGVIGEADVLYGKSPSLPTLVPLVNGTERGAGHGATLGLGDPALAVNGTVLVAAKGGALYDAWTADGNLLLSNTSVVLGGTWGFGPVHADNVPFTARIPGVYGTGFTTTLHDHGVDRVWPVTPYWTTQTGSRAFLECSGRGTCDYVTGLCLCQSGYASSDGFGNVGRKPDCGHVRKFQHAG